MILIISIIAYIILTAGIIFLSNQLLKNKGDKKRKKNRKWIISSSIILFPILGFLYFTYLFAIAVEDHYDVKKGTFLWYVRMDNKTITEFPVIEPAGNVIYNSIGGDSPSITIGWEIEYLSKKYTEDLRHKIIEYLNKEGFAVNEVEKTEYYWTGKYKKDKMNQLYSGFNKEGESLDLLFQIQNNGMTRIQCTIVY